MMLPGGVFLDALFRVVGPFGTSIQRFTGVRQDGRLCFEGYSVEDDEATVWTPRPEMIREITLVAHAR